MCVCYVPMLPVSVDCLFLICHSVFSDVYLVLIINKQWINKIKRDAQYLSTGNHVKTTVIITLVATHSGTKIGPLLCQTNPRKQSDKMSVDNPSHKPWPYIYKTFGSLVLYSNIHWIVSWFAWFSKVLKINLMFMDFNAFSCHIHQREVDYCLILKFSVSGRQW